MPKKEISIRLANDALQVFGAVNSTEVNWIQSDDNVWTATCERSKDPIYDVRLRIVDGFDIEYEYQIKLTDEMYLITDRTRQDVLRVLSLNAKWEAGTITASEQLEWSMNMKGAYNASDLNRVGAAVARITERLAAAGIFIQTVGKADWTEADYNNEAALDYYLKDVSLVRGALAVLDTTPPVPDDLQGLTWVEANNIEKILEDVDMLITNMMLAWYYAGDIYTGEV